MPFEGRFLISLGEIKSMPEVGYCLELITLYNFDNEKGFVNNWKFMEDSRFIGM